MTAALALDLPPAPAPTRSHPQLPPRRYDLDRELIPTACGRLVERVKETARAHRYRLWEPVLSGRRYGCTRRDKHGREWALAHTLRPAMPLPYDAAVEHELKQQRDAMGVLRSTVIELGLRDEGKPAGSRLAVFEACGEILLWTDPEARAALVRSQKAQGGR